MKQSFFVWRPPSTTVCLGQEVVEYGLIELFLAYNQHLERVMGLEPTTPCLEGEKSEKIPSIFPYLKPKTKASLPKSERNRRPHTFIVLDFF